MLITIFVIISLPILKLFQFSYGKIEGLSIFFRTGKLISFKKFSSKFASLKKHLETFHFGDMTIPQQGYTYTFSFFLFILFFSFPKTRRRKGRRYGKTKPHPFQPTHSRNPAISADKNRQNVADVYYGICSLFFSPPPPAVRTKVRVNATKNVCKKKTTTRPP